MGAIFLGMVEVPSSKIVFNLPRTYKKLYCKGDRQAQIMFLYYMDNLKT